MYKKVELYSTETKEMMRFWFQKMFIGNCFETDADDRESTLKMKCSDNQDEQTTRQENKQGWD